MNFKIYKYFIKKQSDLSRKVIAAEKILGQSILILSRSFIIH